MRADGRDWLRLARTENVGPVTFHKLLARFSTPAAALKTIPGLAARGGRARALVIPSVAEVEDELRRGAAAGARLLCTADDDYPPQMRACDAPPPVVWIKGHVNVLRKPAVALVGSRNASAAGLKLARDMAAELGRAGYVTISGLARGIDASVHQATLASGTVAVLGGGVDQVYPAEHADLYVRIAEAGCIVSESPVGHVAQARDFPRRNRIIAALAQGTVVVEAALKSGSLITAKLALEMNREVMAVPGSPLDPRARGTNDLLRQGATLVESAADVVAALTQLRHHLRQTSQDDLFSGGGIDPGVLDQAVEQIRTPLLALLSPVPVSRDELVRQTGSTPAIVAAALLELELAGLAEVMPGNVVVLRQG